MEWRESMIVIIWNVVWAFAIILKYWFKLLLYLFLSGWAITFLLHWEINIWFPPTHWNVVVTDAWIACIILLHMHHVWADRTIAFTVVAVAHQTDTVVKLLWGDSIHSVEAWNEQYTLGGSMESKNACHGQLTQHQATCKGLLSKKHCSCIAQEQLSTWILQEGLRHWRWESYSMLLFQTVHWPYIIGRGRICWNRCQLEFLTDLSTPCCGSTQGPALIALFIPSWPEFVLVLKCFTPFLK